MAIEPKFSDCDGCRFFFRSSLLEPKRCQQCGVGEYFEPRVNDDPPDDNELMKMFARMEHDSQD